MPETQKILTLFEYRRVSTKTQKRNMTIKRQEIINNKYMLNNSDKYNVIKVFTDDGKSGYGTEEREAYNQMLVELENNDIVNGIFATNLDRIGREAEELMRLKRILKERNQVIVLSQGDLVDFSSPVGEFILNIRIVVGEYIRKELMSNMQIMRQKKYEEHPEIFGAPKKFIPEKLKKKIIYWYEKEELGVLKISRLIKTEDINSYPELKEMKFISFGTGKKNYNLSPDTIRARLIEWGIKMRDPKFRKTTNRKGEKD